MRDSSGEGLFSPRQDHGLQSYKLGWAKRPMYCRELGRERGDKLENLRTLPDRGEDRATDDAWKSCGGREQSSQLDSRRDAAAKKVGCPREVCKWECHEQDRGWHSPGTAVWNCCYEEGASRAINTNRTIQNCQLITLPLLLLWVLIPSILTWLTRTNFGQTLHSALRRINSVPSKLSSSIHSSLSSDSASPPVLIPAVCAASICALVILLSLSKRQSSSPKSLFHLISQRVKVGRARSYNRLQQSGGKWRVLCTMGALGLFCTPVSGLRCYTDVTATKSNSVECGLNTGCVKIYIDSEEYLMRHQLELGVSPSFGEMPELPPELQNNPVKMRGCFVLAVPDRCYMAKNGLSYCWCSTKDLCNGAPGSHLGPSVTTPSSLLTKLFLPLLLAFVPQVRLLFL